jgi:hypothetical protein
MTKSKTILLGMPKDFELHNLIQKNLEFHGFEVIKIIAGKSSISKFRYKNLGDRLVNFFRKNFLNDREFKKKLIKENLLEAQFSNTLCHKKFDFGLFIRADFFDEEILKMARNKTKNLVSYHYDGLSRNPEIFSKIKFFDKFYVFDKPDLYNKKHETFPATNFYFDYDECTDDKDQENEVDFYFLGSYHKSRMHNLAYFEKYTKAKGYSSENKSS